jgi:hypothetical protein
MKLDEFPFGPGSQSWFEMRDANNECSKHGRCPFDPDPPCGCFPIERPLMEVVHQEPRLPQKQSVPHRLADILVPLYVRHLHGESVRSLARSIWRQHHFSSVDTAKNSILYGWRTRGLAPRPRKEAFLAARAEARLPGSPGIAAGKEYRHWQLEKEGRRRPCKGVKQGKPHRGRPCASWAMDDSDFCYRHDPRFAEAREAHTRKIRARRRVEREREQIAA